ncbi:MAG TPA: RNA polymerase sigma factor [Kofleriaceae bacterium]
MAKVLREDPVAASVSSDKEAERQRLVEHRPYLRELAKRLCRTQLDPDDLLQDLFEKALHMTIPEGANERAWLARVMQNLFIDKLRRQNARRENLTDEVFEAREEHRVWWETLTEDAVRRQLVNLPADQRETFELFAFRGYSYEEIAAKLGIAKATVGTRILRARKRLRELLSEENLRG